MVNGERKIKNGNTLPTYIRYQLHAQYMQLCITDRATCLSNDQEKYKIH